MRTIAKFFASGILASTLVTFGAHAQYQTAVDFNPAPYTGQSIMVSEALAKWNGFGLNLTPDDAKKLQKAVFDHETALVSVFMLPQLTSISPDEMVRELIAKNQTVGKRYPGNHILVAIGRRKDRDSNPYGYEYGMSIGPDLEQYTRYPTFANDVAQILKDEAFEHGLSKQRPKLIGESDGTEKADIMAFSDDVEKKIAEVIAEHGGPGHGQKLAGRFILALVLALFFVIIYLMRKERVRLFKELRGDKTGD